jgi:Tol biopolymer transport system component/DNA-binding winged helix-turn-helix (wHTH) protein
MTRRGVAGIFKKGSKAAKIVIKELSKNFQKPSMSSTARHFYEFGAYTLDAGERVLRRGEESVHLTPKEFETLLALVRGAGRVMSKEELLKGIWPDTFVGEATLAQNVFTLRKALGEAEGGKPYIETVPRRGYRFAVKVVARVEGEASAAHGVVTKDASALVGARTDDESRAVVNRPASDAAGTFEAATAASDVFDEETAARPSSQDAGARETDNGHAPTAKPSSTSVGTRRTEVHQHTVPQPAGHPVRAAVLIALAVLATVAALVYVVFRFSVRPDTERAGVRPAAGFQSMKVTRLPVTGVVAEAVISPDGNYLAYSANEQGREGMSVWVRQIGAASNTQQLVAPAAGTFYGGLVFSPDSKHVYYGVAHDPARPPELFRVPVLGGPPERIVEAFGGNGGPPAFSPDGRSIAYVRGHFGGEMSLVVRDLAGGGERAVFTRKGPFIFGLPAWSPDGRRIAVAYGSAETADNGTPSLGVTSFDVGDGAESRVTEPRWVGVTQLSWLPDGSGLVLSATEQELSPAQIWTLSFPAGEVRRVTNDLNTYVGASMTADGSALVTVQTDRVPNIWVAPGGDAARARQLTVGSGKFDGYYGLSWMPDGRLVYASIASGSWDVWVMNADGTGQRQLTVGARSNYGPSASADGRFVVFVSNRAGGAFNIWRMEADGSNPVRLTSGRGENFPHVTPDGRFVVYATTGAGESSAVWKVPIDGGEPVRLTSQPASWPFVSPDGKSFVCTYGGGPFAASKLAVISIEGGEPVRLYDVPPSFQANTVWLPDNRGIAFLDSRTGTTNVWMQPLSGGKPVQLTDFKTDSVAAFDWSRDNRLAATRSVETTGVVLIKDFR